MAGDAEQSTFEGVAGFEEGVLAIQRSQDLLGVGNPLPGVAVRLVLVGIRLDGGPELVLLGFFLGKDGRIEQSLELAAQGLAAVGDAVLVGLGHAPLLGPTLGKLI